MHGQQNVKTKRLVFKTEVGVFTARYGLSPYITHIRFVFEISNIFTYTFSPITIKRNS